MQRKQNFVCYKDMKQILSILFFVLLFSCKKKESNPNGPALLRIKNKSAVLLDSVKIQLPSGTYVYSSLTAGQSSEYHAFEYIYGYAFVKIYFNGRMLQLIPFDYVGESVIKGGNHRYEINLSSSSAASFELNYVKE